MGILKKIGSGIKSAEEKYHEIEKDSRPIRKAGQRAFDWIIPPLKKKEKKEKKVKMTCTCQPKKKKRR